MTRYRPGDGTPMGAVLELVNQINRAATAPEVNTTVWLTPDGPPEVEIELYDADGGPIVGPDDLTHLDGRADGRALSRLIAESLVRGGGKQ